MQINFVEIFASFMVLAFVIKYWVDLFDAFPEFKEKHAHLYIKGLHNMLSVLYYCLDNQRHDFYLKQFEQFCEETSGDFDRNTESMAFIYLNTAKLNNIILTGKFTETIYQPP